MTENKRQWLQCRSCGWSGSRIEGSTAPCPDCGGTPRPTPEHLKGQRGKRIGGKKSAAIRAVRDTVVYVSRSPGKAWADAQSELAKDKAKS